MKLTPFVKGDKEFRWWPDNSFLDNWFDFPTSKFGKNMQKMKTDIIEKEKDYIIKIDVPGYKKEDLKIHVGENYLTVFASHEENKDEVDENGKYVHRERYLGTSSRSFYIGNIKEENIKAKYENGTLEVTIDKTDFKEAESPKYLHID